MNVKYPNSGLGSSARSTYPTARVQGVIRMTPNSGGPPVVGGTAILNRAASQIRPPDHAFTRSKMPQPPALAQPLPPLVPVVPFTAAGIPVQVTVPARFTSR